MNESRSPYSTNSELVLDYLDTVWNQGRIDLAEKFLAEGLVQHNPNLSDGRAPLVEFIATLRERVPGLHFDVRRTASDGDLVFVHSLCTVGPGDRGSAVIDVFRIDRGLIIEHWDVKEPVPDSSVSGHPIV